MDANKIPRALVSLLSASLLFLLPACGDGGLGAPAMNEGPWPPAERKTPPADFTPEELRFTQSGFILANGDFMPLPAMFKSASDGWVNVFADKSMQPDKYGQFAGSAMTVTEQDFELQGNIFALPVRTDRFLPTEFVVLSYNDALTAVRLREGTDDRYAFFEVITVDENRRVNRTLSFDTIMPGARVHIGSDVYELRKEGWFIGNQLISEVRPI